MAEMKLWIVVQTTAAETLVPIRDGPPDHISNGIVIEVQLQRHSVIKPKVFGKDILVFQGAKCKCYNPIVQGPHK